MGATPAVENAVVDRVTASIINTLTAGGSTVRFYNANGYELVTATRAYSESEADWLL